MLIPYEEDQKTGNEGIKHLTILEGRIGMNEHEQVLLLITDKGVFALASHQKQ